MFATSFPAQAHFKSSDRTVEKVNGKPAYVFNVTIKQGFFNKKMKRIEYIDESSFDSNLFLSSSGPITILRTVYAYYPQGDQKHRVDVIHVKKDKKSGAIWEETIKSYSESHSFKKVYSPNYRKVGDYAYYPYDYVCTKCKHRKKGGVDKIYVGPGNGMPDPNSNKAHVKDCK